MYILYHKLEYLTFFNILLFFGLSEQHKINQSGQHDHWQLQQFHWVLDRRLLHAFAIYLSCFMRQLWWWLGAISMSDLAQTTLLAANMFFFYFIKIELCARKWRNKGICMFLSVLFMIVMGLWPEINTYSRCVLISTLYNAF